MTDDGHYRRVVCRWRSGQETTTEWMHRSDPRIRNLLSQVDAMEWVRLERKDDHEGN